MSQVQCFCIKRTLFLGKFLNSLGHSNIFWLNFCCLFHKMKTGNSRKTGSFHCLLFPFKDLLNFDDPLNIEAAEHHLRDKVSYSQNILG